MELIRDAFSTEYERIRKHVLTQIAKSGSSSMRLASSREMAKEFGVTQTTVVRALKDLVTDGYVTIKPGIGAFTNPSRLGYPKDVKVFGLLHGDGKHIFPVRAYWTMASAFAEALMRRSKRFQLQNYFLSGRDIVDELSSSGLDGVLWILPDDKSAACLPELKKAGLAVLAVERNVPGVSSIHFDFTDDNMQVAKMMLKAGRRKIMLAISSGKSYDVKDDRAYGLQAAYEEAGIPFDESYIIDNATPAGSSFQNSLLRLRPDGIIFNTSIDLYWNALKECKDILGDCMLYSGAWSVFDDMGFSGIVGVPDLKDAALEGAANLISQLELGDEAPIVSGRLKMKFIDSKEIEA